MSKLIVDDDSVGMALDWLRDNAAALGLARGKVHRFEREEEAVEAKLYRSVSIPGEKSSIEDRKNYARAHPEYRQACEATAGALEELERLRTMKTRCEMLIQVWQTQSANLRGKM